MRLRFGPFLRLSRDILGFEEYIWLPLIWYSFCDIIHQCCCMIDGQWQNYISNNRLLSNVGNFIISYNYNYVIGYNLIQSLKVGVERNCRRILRMGILQEKRNEVYFNKKTVVHCCMSNWLAGIQSNCMWNSPINRRVNPTATAVVISCSAFKVFSASVAKF